MYIGYFDETAHELIQWSFEALKAGNKSKAIKIEKLADKYEIKYRTKHKISLDKDVWWYKPYINEYKYAHLIIYADKI